MCLISLHHRPHLAHQARYLWIQPEYIASSLLSVSDTSSVPLMSWHDVSMLSTAAISIIVMTIMGFIVGDPVSLTTAGLT